MASAVAESTAGISQQTQGAPENGRVLEHLLTRTAPCLLAPFRFFVSWQGVLTLAFRCESWLMTDP
jgi:hypothetical protein